MRQNKSVRKWLIALGLVALGGLVTLFVATITMQSRVKHRVEKLLADRFDSDVKIESLSAAVFPVATVWVKNVEIRHHHRTDVPPMIAIAEITAHSDWISLLFGAQHDVSRVQLDGLRITIPPGGVRHSQGETNRQPAQDVDQDGNHLPFVIHEIVANGATLTTLPKEQGKVPLQWDIESLTMHSVGSRRAMNFVATLTNAKPPGRIKSEGKFGPWQKEDPGDTEVSGNYTFKDADMGVFKGISGVLSSVGTYRGSLDSIDVDGTTEIPDFQVGNGTKVNLKTKFSATVNGTKGDTLLHPVEAKFLNSEFICQGGVVGTPGVKGKKVTLDVATKQARMEDILRLVMHLKGEPPISGATSFKAKMVLPQGDVPVLEKLFLDGQFGITSATFGSDKVQGKLDELSSRSLGKGDAPPSEVASNLRGRFVLKNSAANFSSLSFTVPGIRVHLDGSYGLRSEQIDFKGKIDLDGKLSQMTTGWKSLLLKAADPFFRKNKETVIPVKVGGTKDDPKFGLALPGSK
jgi:hypothetical protein